MVVKPRSAAASGLGRARARGGGARRVFQWTVPIENPDHVCRNNFSPGRDAAVSITYPQRVSDFLRHATVHPPGRCAVRSGRRCGGVARDVR
eukprot:gene25766-biopygen12022